MLMRLILFVFISILMFASCKTTKSGSNSGFENEIFGVEGLSCNETLNPDAIDSRVGILTCAETEFYYDYGRYSNRGPLSVEEEFRRSFDSYHHIKFFEDRMIDPKVYKIFLDSVEVIDVRKKVDSDQLMYACEPCNAVSQLTFKGDTYLFPVTMSEKQLSDQGTQITIEQKGDYIYKYYQRKGEQPGVFVSPVKNRYRKKNCLSVSVKKTEQNNTELMALLKRVYLK